MTEPREPRRPDRRIPRFLALWVATTTVFYSLITVFMPPGIARADHMVLVLILFLVVFLSIAIFEPSVAVNVALPLAFWCPMFVLHTLYPGTAPGKTERIIDGVLVLSCIALGHTALQGSLALMSSHARRK